MASPARPASPASTPRSSGQLATGRDVRPGVRARRPGVQDQRGAVPHVDARRLRGRADAGDDVLRQRAQGRCGGAGHAASRSRRSAPRSTPGARWWCFAALASIVVGALGAIGQKNIKRLLAYSSIINNVGFILIGLACGDRSGRERGAGLPGDLRRDDRRQFRRGADAQGRRTGSRSRRSPDLAGMALDSAGAGPGAWAMLMFQPCRASRRCSASGASSWCSRPRSRPTSSRLRFLGMRGLGDRRVLRHQDRQDHVSSTSQPTRSAARATRRTGAAGD